MMDNQTATDDEPIAPLLSLSVTEFCERYRLTKTTYFQMRKRGEGPEEIRIGSRMIRITETAAVQWVQDRTAPKS
ncbi:hypothetical protein [Paraburkholderia sp. J67]|uniref:helix-turn-helix transcriptional regulator n=1 Tax=Paraburkholderia sp. J67 TaxID=2805435 RepID=UPI002ABE4D31|nr:hypothetical protein [Paraburkholderia sp. J67]